MNRSKQRQQQRLLLLRHIVASHCERQADRARRAGTAADASSFHHPPPEQGTTCSGCDSFRVAPLPQCPHPDRAIPSPLLLFGRFPCLLLEHASKHIRKVTRPRWLNFSTVLWLY